jgi:ABC-type glycerol-3-phosphate transport system substrate-binding protein
MPRQHRLALACALLGLALAALSGCAQAAPTPVPVTIRFACPRDTAAFFEPLAATFHESHPGIIAGQAMAQAQREAQ